MSNPLQTNDKKEVKFFEECVYNTKEGNEIRKQIEENIRGIIGDPFVLSFVHHRHKTNEGEPTPSFEIPMWKMYGDNFRGVRLRLNFKKLEEFSKGNNMCLSHCKYKQKTSMIEEGRSVRKSSDDTTLESLYKQVVLYKVSDWEYENEWRLVTWCNEIESKEFSHMTGRQFICKTLPLDLLDEIEIGPKADYEAYEGVFKLLKEKLGDVDTCHFKISRSKLQIGYI